MSHLRLDTERPPPAIRPVFEAFHTAPASGGNWLILEIERAWSILDSSRHVDFAQSCAFLQKFEKELAILGGVALAPGIREA